MRIARATLLKDVTIDPQLTTSFLSADKGVELHWDDGCLYVTKGEIRHIIPGGNVVNMVVASEPKKAK